MASAEKFCLRWNDFESNINTAFRELRQDKDFFDVTLACDDDQIQAHKVILSACSPFFRTILKRNIHEHPLLYLKGVRYTDLTAVLNFMYHGEVNVAQEDLNSFLAIAEDLKVKGLTQNKSEGNSREQVIKKQTRNPPDRSVSGKNPSLSRQCVSDQSITPAPSFQADDEIQEILPVKTEPVPEPPHHVEVGNHTEQDQGEVVDHSLDNSIAMYEDNYAEYGHYEEGDGMMTVHDSAGNRGLELYEEMLKSMIERVEDGTLIQCTICKRSYKASQTTNLKNHIEAKHIDNVRFSCAVCGGVFSSRASFRTHSRNFHKDISHVPFNVSQVDMY